MRAIALTQGKVAIVGNNDFERLAVYKWYALKVTLKTRVVWYAVRKQRKSDGKQGLLYMHRDILGVTDSTVLVDHRSGNTLDNRRRNIRIATSSQNQQNSFKRSGCSSRFKGVYRFKRTGRWQAHIQGKGCKQHLGYFATEEAAAEAYDAAAKRKFGEFALTNGS